ncbi:uncharacterized protein LOC130551096 [Triplophysa rosa]|uniref:uncharacterized protein LOC130551096 n=1 Tax=Triplophysa rosa TaxID=992332 RepID=UPI002546250F|nr:uncharacterized protein LOC130551096 [Triplophysa rosa]
MCRHRDSIPFICQKHDKAKAKEPAHEPTDERDPHTIKENLALRGTVTQSSTNPNWLAQHAIDGVRYGDVSTYCAGTASQSNPWWRLDLLDVYNISTVIITAHGSYLSQANRAEIRIGNSLDNNGNNNPICAVTPDPLPGNTVSLSCGVMEGRYVNVILSGRTSYLTLCEVEVYETENLAVKGAVTQSSTYLTWTPQHAIDGVRYGPDPDDVPYCSHTTSQSNPWWRLDLLDVCDISTVIITARSDCCVAQINGAEIRIGNSLVNNGNNNPICAVTSGVLAGHTISYSCYGMEGRYVNVVMTGRTSPLTLCEVEVYGKCHRKKYFLRLKFSSSGDVAAESDKILHQLQSALASHISDFNLSWTQLPEEEEKPRADRGSCVKHL